MKQILTFVLLVTAVVQPSYGQQGVSSASVSRARTESENPSPTIYRRGLGPVALRPSDAPDPIAIEEIINYHRHHLPMPANGKGIALDLRWGNGDGPAEPRAERASIVDDSGLYPGSFADAVPPAVLQVGLATAEFRSTRKLRPLNLALVIDHSGSMRDADKMIEVKAALRTLIGNLKPADIVSIIAFDDSAQVLLPASPIGSGRQHLRVIESIQPAGSTNINAGLMLGYQEVLRNFSQEKTNRVILLTDGIANTGETNPLRIASNSAGFNERGIDLSTIGVGRDLDNDLLRTLAKRGRGLYHFVADARDIEKIFVEEVQSLLSPVARNVQVEITSNPALRLEQVYGYQPRRNGDRVTVDLDDMNNGATQVILLRYAPFASGQVDVRLRYFDIDSQRNVEEVQRVLLRYPASDSLRDPEVRKNFTIATIAQGLSDMQKDWQRQNYRGAENVLRQAIRETRARYAVVSDPDILAQLKVAENYLNTLQGLNYR